MRLLQVKDVPQIPYHHLPTPLLCWIKIEDLILLLHVCTNPKIYFKSMIPQNGTFLHFECATGKLLVLAPLFAECIKDLCLTHLSNSCLLWCQTWKEKENISVKGCVQVPGPMLSSQWLIIIQADNQKHQVLIFLSLFFFFPFLSKSFARGSEVTEQTQTVPAIRSSVGTFYLLWSVIFYCSGITVLPCPPVSAETLSA